MKKCMHLFSVMLFFVLSLPLMAVHGKKLTEEQNELYKKLNNLIHDDKPCEVIELLSSGADDKSEIVNYMSKNGMTLVHFALSLPSVDIRIVDALLKNGGLVNEPIPRDIGKKFYKGYTAAHIAVRRQKSVEIFEKLKQNQVDFFNADAGQWRAIDLVFHEGNAEVVAWFAQNYDLSKYTFKKTKSNHHYVSLMTKALPGHTYYECGPNAFNIRRNSSSTMEPNN